MILRKFVVAFVVVANTLAPNWALGLLQTRAQLTGTEFNETPARDAKGFDSSYRLSLLRPVQDKNFYLLSLFQRNREVRILLSKHAPLHELTVHEESALKRAESCNNTACFDDLFRFGDETIQTVAAALDSLANQPAFKRLAKRDLRPSGVFIKYAEQSDAQMWDSAWKDAANGINRIFSVYCLGKDPRYPAIDKVSFDVSSEAYRQLMKARIKEVKLGNDSLFFEPALNFALSLLEINRRDEAGRYEPLERGENKAAVQNLKHIKWTDYTYSFILVLGSGPSDSAKLSRIGAQRADFGAELFLQRKAPLIILSGGHVHPMQTPYCEAIEMKKYVMEKYKIPEANILIDPHARHTTTNFRNAVRLAFRYGIPTDEPALVTSSEDHIDSCARDEFRIRNVNELGYFPVEFIKRISPITAEFKPSVLSLFFDSSDPLDP